MEKGGWIKTYRKLTQWEWYKNGPTKDVFLHLLLIANVEDKKWHNILISRGQVVTSIRILSKDLNLTERQIRTALINLQSTNEIIVEATHKNSLITIVKYEKYQDKSSKDDTVKYTSESDTVNDTQNAHKTTHKTTQNKLNNDNELNNNSDTVNDTQNAHKTTHKTTTTKEEKNKRIYNIILPQNLKEVEDYFKENHLTSNPIEFYTFYDSLEWIDTTGKQIKNWKLKARTWEANKKAREIKQQPIIPKRVNYVIDEMSLPPEWYKKFKDKEVTVQDLVAKGIVAREKVKVEEY